MPSLQFIFEHLPILVISSAAGKVFVSDHLLVDLIFSFRFNKIIPNRCDNFSKNFLRIFFDWKENTRTSPRHTFANEFSVPVYASLFLINCEMDSKQNSVSNYCYTHR